MLREKLEDEFEFIVFFDSEFRGNMKERGELNDVVCFVFKELKTGKITKTHGKNLNKLPYPNNNKTLWIAHNVGAETHSMLSLKLGRPKYIWDTMIEDKKLYFGRVKGHSMLRAANRYGIETISEDLKKYYVDLILSKKNYTKEEFEKILDYCLSDVLTLEKLFLKQLKDIEKLKPNAGPHDIISQAIFSGDAMTATAQVEFSGIPINNKLLSKITDNYPIIRKEIIDEINSRLDIYDKFYTLKKDKLYALVKRLGLLPRWPVTPTGRLKEDEKTIFRFAQESEEINDLYLSKEFVDSEKLKGFVVGPDGRARTPLYMYGLKTGRTNQSTALYPFNCAKPKRNIIKADTDKILIYFDYKNQEIAIAAYLSRDPHLMAAVESGDPYIKTAQFNNSVPDDATKKTHPVIRNQFKTALLACLYGQGIKNMSAALAISHDAGTSLHVKIKNTFRIYFEWIKRAVDKSLVRGFMVGRLGFRYWIEPGGIINPRTIYNYPIQTNGSEMLRLAAIKICDAGIECNALIHDGLLIHVPRKKFRKQFMKVKKIMENASRKILNKDKSTDYVCNVEWQLIRTGMIQDPPEQKKWNRILKIINKHTRVKKINTWGKNTQVKKCPRSGVIASPPYSITMNNTYK